MPENNRIKAKRTLTIAGLALVAAGCVAAYFLYGKQLIAFFSDPVQVNGWLEQYGLWAKTVFVTFRALQTLVKFIPAECMDIAAGYAFGTWAGLFYCLLGTMIGSLLILLLMRMFGLKLLYLFVPKEKIESYAFLKNQKKLGVTLFFLYLVPGTPKDFITYLIGCMPFNKGWFLLFMGIARIPSIVTSTWCGAKLIERDYKMAAVIFGATTVISVAAMLLYRQYEKQRKAKEKAACGAQTLEKEDMDMTLQEKMILQFWGFTKKKDDERIASLTPTPGIEELNDIAYIADGHQGHLLDIYYPQGTTTKLPVIIDIHGGGFMYGYKELNKLYNLYLSSLGFTVISLSYRLAPEVRFPAQVQDISAAFHWIAAHGAEYPCDMENMFVTGDSAGGLFAVLLPLAEHSPALREIYNIEASGLRIRAIGTVSGALSMTKGGLGRVLSKPVFGAGYQKQAAFRCLDMRTIPNLEQLPPCYLVTSKQDFVQNHSLEFAQILEARGVAYQLRDWPKAAQRRLDHVFSVTHPTWEESIITSGEMTAFFMAQCSCTAPSHSAIKSKVEN